MENENDNKKQDNIAKYCVEIICCIAIVSGLILFFSGATWAATVGVIALSIMGIATIYLLLKKK